MWATGLTFIPYVLLGVVMVLVKACRRDDRGYRALLLMLIGNIGFVIAVRVHLPWRPHNDFRFGLPAILPCCVAFALAAGMLRRALRARFPHVAAYPGVATLLFCGLAEQVILFWS